MNPSVSSTPSGTLIVLDNQDSFTYNLVDELAQLGFQVEVFRNTVELEVITNRLASLSSNNNGKTAQPVTVVLSPGPGYPNKAGNMMALIQHCVGRYPLLGICLGFQAIIEHFGGTIGRCANAAHGKSAIITTCAHPIFSQANGGLAREFTVARYHSLQADQVPSELDIIASYQGIPMAICHQQLPIAGLQFHPESIMTIRGSDILRSSISFLTQGLKQATLETQNA